MGGRLPGRLKALLVAGVLGALVACGSESPADAVASARGALDKKDYQAAVIHLKTALEQTPESGEMRFLLGDTLQRMGDSAGAVVELSKARESVYPDDKVVPLLANALLATAQPKKVIDQFGKLSLSTPALNAGLKASLASAHAALGDFAQCQAHLTEALQLDPRNNPARLLQARLTAGKGGYDEALRLVEAVLADTPQDAHAWVLKAHLLTVGKRDAEGSIQAYQRAQQADPTLVPAYSGLIDLLHKRNDVAGVKTQVQALTKAAPQSLEALFYTTELAVLEGDLKRARDGAQRLLSQAPGFPPALQMAGIVFLQLGDLAQAQTHLSQAVQLAPNVHQARRLLAEAQLRAGAPAKTVATLQPLLELSPASAADLGLAAQAYLQEGDLAKAEAMYGLAAKANPEDNAPRVALALAQLARGDATGGLAELESLASADKSAYADLALVTALMQRKDFDGALKAVERLEGKPVAKFVPHLMRARIQTARMDSAGARASLDKALAADPQNFTVLAELSALDMAEGRDAAALQRYESVVARDPQNMLAALAVVDLKRRTGAKPAELEPMLQDIVKRFPADAPPRLALVQHHLANRENSAALSAAQNAASTLPNDLRVLDALGRAQLASGETRQAMSTFQKAAAQATQPEPLLRLAEIQSGMGDHAGAQATAQRAAQLAPRSLVAPNFQIRMALARGKVADALKVVRGVQQQRPNEAVGYVMEGDVHAGQKAWPAAATAYKQAFDREPSTESARRLHGALVAGARLPEAAKLADSWMAARPRDIDFRLYLGSSAAERKDFAAAEQHFRQALTLSPDNAVALNNTATVILQQGKSGALPLAERALKLAPQHAAFLDTLASAQAAEKQWPQAIETQKKAVAQAPAVPVFRLNLARLLIESGDKAQARTELQALAALGEGFAAQAEVTALLKRL